jgi:hypothetical protein
MGARAHFLWGGGPAVSDQPIYIPAALQSPQRAERDEVATLGPGDEHNHRVVVHGK